MQEKNSDAIGEIEKRAAEEFRQRASMIGCETAINLMLTCMTADEVTAFLEGQISMIEVHG